MVDVHSATAEIRRGKRKEEERKIEELTTGQKYNVRICYADVFSVFSFKLRKTSRSLENRSTYWQRHTAVNNVDCVRSDGCMSVQRAAVCFEMRLTLHPY